MHRLALPLTFKARDGLFDYAEWQMGDPNAFFDPYEIRMLDGVSRLSADSGHPDAIITYGLGSGPREWLAAEGLAYRTERIDEVDADGHLMFIHLPDEESARRFTETFLS